MTIKKFYPFAKSENKDGENFSFSLHSSLYHPQFAAGAGYGSSSAFPRPIIGQHIPALRF